MDETNKNTNKRQYIKVMILVVALVVLAFSGTYAYFVNSNAKEPTVTSAKSGVFKVTSSLENASAIKNPRLVLIEENQRDTKADKLTFTVTSTSESTVDGTFNLYMQDIELTKNLYTKYLKWELLDEAGTILADGGFENAKRVGTAVDGEVDNVLTNVEQMQLNTTGIDIPKNTTKTYTFRMYLLNDPNKNQIDLTEGSFSGRLYLKAVPVSSLNPQS